MPRAVRTAQGLPARSFRPGWQGDKQATLIRAALRAGLPIVINRYQAPRPEGYFASDYKKPDKERLRLEAAMAKVKQRPER